MHAKRKANKNTPLKKSFVLFLALVGACALLASDALAAGSNGANGAGTQTVIVGQSTVVNTPWPTVRVAVTDPAIANVQVLTSTQVLLQGLDVGSTDLIVWSQDETEVRQWKVKVVFDAEHFQQRLNELFPHSQLLVSEADESLVVKGLLRTAEQAKQLDDYMTKSGVQYLNMTSLAGVQQVQLQVRIAEVSRTGLRALGINAFIADERFFGASRTGTASGGASNPTIAIGPAAEGVAGAESYIFPADVTPSSAVTVLAGFPKSNMEFFLHALVENQYMRILANPTLVALSGEEASFLAGGEYPIPVVQGTGGGAGGGTSISIEYREYGVRLRFKPTVLGDGTIRLHVSPEVSDLTDVGAVTIETFEVPALTTRKAETTLELKSGQTFAMAGLIKHNIDATNSRVPGLGDVPVLGALFRSTRYQERETEMVVLVTASLVEPLSLAQMPPLPGFLHVRPDDWQLYLEGGIQGKEPAKIDQRNAEWLKEIGLDELMGPGAWDSYQQQAAPSSIETTEMEVAQPDEAIG